MAWWEQEVRDRLAEGPATAYEIGKIVGCYGPDAVCRVKSRLPLAIVGTVPRGIGTRGKSVNLYALATQHQWSARRDGLVPMKERK